MDPHEVMNLDYNTHDVTPFYYNPMFYVAVLAVVLMIYEIYFQKPQG